MMNFRGNGTKRIFEQLQDELVCVASLLAAFIPVQWIYDFNCNCLKNPLVPLPRAQSR